jgi:hypothetical protein
MRSEVETPYIESSMECVEFVESVQGACVFFSLPVVE